MGGVKRHCPVFSSTWNWSKRPRESEGELPLQASSASLRQMTKPRPGTPSRHLLEEAASASKATSRASSGRAPKALMASISRRRPALATIAATSATGVSTPDVVSHWTTATWLMAGSTRRRSEFVGAPPVDGDEFRIPRTPVVEHGLFHGERGGERAGGEQPGILGCPVGRGHGSSFERGAGVGFRVAHLIPRATIRQITGFYILYRFFL